MQILLKTTPYFLILLNAAMAEERLSWFARDQEMRSSIFVPDDLPEGKEENRVLPWVFHSDWQNDKKLMEIKCMMRGYNASNNPSDYQEARWSHPGFDDSQVDTSAVLRLCKERRRECLFTPSGPWRYPQCREEVGHMRVWQQGDFPLSTDFKFMIFIIISLFEL